MVIGYLAEKLLEHDREIKKTILFFIISQSGIPNISILKRKKKECMMLDWINREDWTTYAEHSRIIRSHSDLSSMGKS